MLIGMHPSMGTLAPSCFTFLKSVASACLISCHFWCLYLFDTLLFAVGFQLVRNTGLVYYALPEAYLVLSHPLSNKVSTQY